MKRSWRRSVMVLAAFAIALATLPGRVCARDSCEYWERRDDAERLGRRVAANLERGVDGHEFRSGDAFFDAEWIFAANMMGAVGLAQLGLAHPNDRAKYALAIDAALATILREPGKRFDVMTWHEDPLATLGSNRGHVAYLGYLNLALGMRRVLDPQFEHPSLHDRITAALERRMLASDDALIETYPGATFPVDCASAAGSLALHAYTTGASHDQALARFVRSIRRRYMDPKTGLLVQLKGSRAASKEVARGSGTLLAAYFLSFADAKLSSDLFESAKRELYSAPFGLGGMREFPRGVDGKVDVYALPAICGFSVAATGFAVGASRVNDDRSTFDALLASTMLLGAPYRSGAELGFSFGGSLGDSMMLAMLTAYPSTRWTEGRAVKP